ncbi:MAG: AraC family transcriptional regulator [Candidatus Eisenbacteria bacterium]
MIDRLRDSLSIEFFRAPANLAIRGHAHERPHLFLLLSGGYEEAVTRGGAARRVRGGGIRFSPAGDRHHLDFSDAANRCAMIEIDPSLAPSLPAHRVYCEGSEVDALLGPVRRAIRASDPVAGLALEGAVLEFLARVGAEGEEGELRTAPPWLRRITDRLASDREGELALSDLSREAGIHPVYAARAFRRFHGCSAGDFIRRLRMERAVDLVRTSALPLAEVALRAGFADQAHLTRSMSRSLGVTPAQLRRKVPPRFLPFKTIEQR